MPGSIVHVQVVHHVVQATHELVEEQARLLPTPIAEDGEPIVIKAGAEQR